MIRTDRAKRAIGAGLWRGLVLGGAIGWAATAWPQADPPDSGRGPGHGGGRLFVSPMGEPFRGPDAMEHWFKGADANGDGRLSRTECMNDAARFFITLDVNGDGEIDPDETTRYETEIVPETHSGGAGFGGGFGGGGGGGHHGGGRGGGGGGRGGGMHRGGGGGGHEEGGASNGGSAPEVPQGAARFGLLDLPEPVIAADTDMNRGVSRVEFRNAALQRCALLDRDSDGYVAWAELPSRAGAGERGRHSR